MKRALLLSLALAACHSEPVEVETSAPPARLTAKADVSGRVVFASTRSGRQQLHVVDVASGRVDRLLVSDGDDYPAATADGRVLFVRARGQPHREQLLSLDLSSGRTMAHGPASTHVRNPVFDSGAVVFESDQESFRSIYRVGDGAPQRLTRDDQGSFEPHVHARQGLVYVSSRTGDAEIFTQKDGHARRLTWSRGDDTNPRWSPDGKQILFVSARTGKPRIHVMRSDGGRPRPLSDNDAAALEDRDASWSPDGEHVVFVRRYPSHCHILVLRLSDGRAKQLSTGMHRDETPAWSPDGRAIAFASNRAGNLDLYLRPLHQDRTMRLTDHAGEDWLPRWLP